MSCWIGVSTANFGVAFTSKGKPKNYYISRELTAQVDTSKHNTRQQNYNIVKGIPTSCAEIS